MDESVCDLLQRRRPTVEGRSFVEITHPADQPRNVVLVGSIRENSAPELIRKRYVRSDGVAVWADVWISRLSGNREPGRLVGTIHLVPTSEVEASPVALWKAARAAEQSMQDRIECLGLDVFVDFVWLLLVRIYIAEAEGLPVHTELLKPSPLVTNSAILRWLRVIASRDWVVGTLAEAQQPQLTAEGVRKIEQLLLNDIKRSRFDEIASA